MDLWKMLSNFGFSGIDTLRSLGRPRFPTMPIGSKRRLV